MKNHYCGSRIRASFERVECWPTKTISQLHLFNQHIVFSVTIPLNVDEWSRHELSICGNNDWVQTREYGRNEGEISATDTHTLPLSHALSLSLSVPFTRKQLSISQTEQQFETTQNLIKPNLIFRFRHDIVISGNHLCLFEHWLTPSPLNRNVVELAEM